VFLKKSDAILFVGASKPARLIANYLKRKGKRIILIDSNKTSVEKSLEAGLDAFAVNIFDDDLEDNIELNSVGYLIAITGSAAVNKYAIDSFSEDLGENGSFRLATSEEIKTDAHLFENNFFTPKDDYINLVEAYREDASIHEVPIKTTEDFDTVLAALNDELLSIPLFVLKKGKIYLLCEFDLSNETKDGTTLVYLGKQLDFKI